MASQERVPGSQPNTQSSTQPDTQNTDILTQSQDLPSQQATLTVWGRLCSVRALLKNFEMIKDTCTLGRAEVCDIRLTKDEMCERWLNTISKVHFRIYKECVTDTNDTLVYLEDTSRNGTFVDKVKVGHGNRVILENNSEIAITKENFSIYMFVNTLMPTLINDLPPELKMKYALGRKLGSGSCGEVRMIFTKDGSRRFAMKIIKKDIFGANGNAFNDQMKNEVEILRRLKHSCIIKMEDIHDTPTAMYIILELMEGGELFDRIKNRGKLTEPCAKLIFYQVVLAVYYLHKHDITHRDLKPENILLKSNSDKTLVKVSDFGLSKLVDARSMMKTFCGTPMYVAPEILATLGRGSYTNQVDVWSLGVILYTCLSGMVPFNVQRKDVSLEEQIRHGIYSLPSQYFGHLSPYAIDLIKRMMTVNPTKRITVSQILLHPWLRDQCMREEAHKLMGTSIYNGQMINDENMPPATNFENRRENNFCPELKRMRFNA